MRQSFTRRQFFKGSIIVALGAASAGALASCAPKAAGSGEEKAGAAMGAASGKAVTLHRGYGAAHGDRGFTQVVAAVAEDGTIVAVNIDEYEFFSTDTEGAVPVPNADAAFGESFAEGFVLISKTDNNDAYSAHMKEKAQSTQSWHESIKAIEENCVGKKAADIDAADAVSGATLVDTPNYTKLILEVVGDDAITAKGSLGEGDAKLSRVNGAAHGEKAFADAVVLVQDGMAVAASIDEFQFMDASTDGLKPVPSSDGKFGANVVEGKALASKSQNSDIYSAHMKEKAQATTEWIASMRSIEDYIAGKKADELKKVRPDAVSGATLVDTVGYVAVAEKAVEMA